MFTSVQNLVSRALRLPAEPHAPFGAIGSVRIFRAGKNYYWFCLSRWAIGQFLALIGIVFSVIMLGRLIDDLNALRDDQGAPAAISSLGSTERVKLPPALAHKLSPHVGWVRPALFLLELAAIAYFIAQLVTTYFTQRLAYELRWYIVTDRSLRIRAGVWNLQETTMSFANLQQVEFSQGPVQRLLGIADLHVQSAGGGEQKEGPHKGESLHTGVFEGVTNAKEIRDLILARLRDYRDSGLGHPSEEGNSLPSPPFEVGTRDEATLAAARELLAEVRDLRRTLTDSAAKS